MTTAHADHVHRHHLTGTQDVAGQRVGVARCVCGDVATVRAAAAPVVQDALFGAFGEVQDGLFDA